MIIDLLGPCTQYIDYNRMSIDNKATNLQFKDIVKTFQQNNVKRGQGGGIAYIK